MVEKTMYASWGDMDFNAHMRNTAYLDKSADLRMMHFAAYGFPMAEFIRLKIGPVGMKDEIEYFREIGLLEAVRVTMELVGLSADGSRCILRNEFWRQDGKLAARVTSSGGWLDLAQRRLVSPPAALLAAILAVPRAEDFHQIASSIKPEGG